MYYVSFYCYEEPSGLAFRHFFFLPKFDCESEGLGSILLLFVWTIFDSTGMFLSSGVIFYLISLGGSVKFRKSRQLLRPRNAVCSAN